MRETPALKTEQYFLKKANDFLKKDDIEEAIDWLEKGLVQTNSMEIAKQLWPLLEQQKEWHELLWLFDDGYLTSDEMPYLYCSTLLYTNQFEKLEKELAMREENQDFSFKTFSIKMAIHKNKKMEMELQKLQLIQSKLADSQKPLSQEESHYLANLLLKNTLPEKEELLKQFLLDKRTSLFDKAVLLDGWVLDGKTEVIMLRKNEQFVSLVKENLRPLSQHPYLLQTEQLLTPLFQTASLEIQELLYQKLKQDTIRLYPFIEEYIHDLKAWVRYFENRVDLFESLCYTDEQFEQQYYEFQRAHLA